MPNVSMNVMDLCTYCELATESIQKAIDMEDHDGAHIRLAAYLLEIHSRYINGEIGTDTWKETLRFYTRMTTLVMSASNP